LGEHGQEIRQLGVAVGSDKALDRIAPTPLARFADELECLLAHVGKRYCIAGHDGRIERTGNDGRLLLQTKRAAETALKVAATPARLKGGD
jgi:hypothetical protein